MKSITYYRVYAERHPDYGRTNLGCFKHKKNAELSKKREMKKYVGKGEPYIDGYYETDWDIEENEIILWDLK